MCAARYKGGKEERSEIEGIKRPPQASQARARARFVSCGAFYETNDLDDHATCHASPPGTALSCFFIALRTARVSGQARTRVPTCNG